MERFQSVMDKLFLSPKSKPPSSSSPSGVESTRGKKRPHPDPMLAVGQTESQERMCRPWDRGDLMRRLATFKSMKWFAKPKVISAVNCARRGWVSVEMDTIACETCGARMLFSTPSAWTQQQVEKAALVFSLKLDNGHKLHCQWIDNVCDEALAQFPPTPDPALVDGYRQRSSALLQLTALPMISSSFIDNIKILKLQQLLTKFLTIKGGNGSDTDTTEYLGNEHETAYASSYYQAQKLIGLCGWEPRSLTYVVDCKNKFDQSVKDANHLDLSDVIAGGPNCSVTVYSSGTKGTIEMNGDPMASGGYQSDPNSVVLDCRLCGASVGLWAFSMVPRPLELLRIVGYAEISGVNSAVHENVDFNHVGTLTSTASNIASSVSSNNSLNLSLTIAGGPPPTKQNFRAKVSLPVIGRNLRTRFFSDSECSKHKLSEVTSSNQDDMGSELLHNGNLLSEKANQENNATGEVVQPELINKIHDDEHCICTNDNCSHILNDHSCQKGDALFKENKGQLLEERDVNEPETSKKHFVRQSTETVVQGFGQTDKLDSNVRDAEAHENDSSSMAVVDSCKEILGDANTETKDFEESENRPYVKDCSIEQLNDEDDNGIENRVQTLATNETEPSATDKDLKQLAFDKAVKFDPIRQHRHFCPWIAMTGNAPGWQLTLSALLQQKEFRSSKNSPSSTSTVKVDDPIMSVRNLFMSPKKRKKLVSGSG